MSDTSPYFGPKPRLKAPARACECHSHIYGPADRYPPAAGAGRSLHADASVGEYLACLGHLGIARAVIVQPSAYGTDNRRTVHAIREIGPERARGVAVCRTAVSRDELAALHAAGIRGFRFTRQGTDNTIDDLPAVAARIAPFGWHVQVQYDGKDALDWMPKLEGLSVPVVIDHIARLPKGIDLDTDPRFRMLLRLLESGNVWLKISGPYYGSTAGHPYADVAPRIARLAEARPDRLVWALNWPHPAFPMDGKPDAAACLDVLLDAVPDEGVRNGILADNAARLYDFPD